MSGSRGGTFYSPGPGLQDMSIIADGGGHSWALHVCAHPGDSAETATPMRASINIVDQAASDGDSVALPSAVGGQLCYVENRTGHMISVWATAGSTDTILSGATTDRQYALAANTMVMFVSTPGEWAVPPAPASGLPSTGGQITGNLTVTGTAQIDGDVFAGGNINAGWLNLSGPQGVHYASGHWVGFDLQGTNLVILVDGAPFATIAKSAGP